jgi:serine/threonine-protein kinase
VAQRDRNPKSSPQSLRPDADALIGQTLDERYLIDAAIGVGGMGAVYRGTHIKLGSQVAIKLLLHQHASSPALRKRFEREAKALAALAHPSIVTVTDYGVSVDIPYLVMELLEGEPLSRRMPRAPFPPSQVLELTQQLLRALSYVHERGLVHRDLKPANVFLQRLPDGEERVKLLDFGLAKFITSAPTSVDQHLTPVGEAVGTPAYMPPEQIAGGPPDARTDVYAMGVILFQMLCGRLPFEGEPMEQLKSHLLSPVPSLAERHPNGKGRPELELVLQRAMAKQPAARFQDAAEMLAALDAVPQPWILAKDADEASSGAMAMAATLVDPRRSEPLPVDPGKSAEPAASPAAEGGDASGDRADALEVTPAPRTTSSRVGRLLAVILLLLLSTGAAALYAIVRARERTTKPVGHASHGESVAAKETRAANAPPPPELVPTAADRPAEALAPAADASAPALAPNATTPTTGEDQPPRAETRPRPQAPRGPARNPWTHGTPKELRTVRKVIAKGGFGTDRSMALLRKYSYTYPDDSRGHLLLARLYLNRHWRADAISQYAAAFQADSTARGAPQMLSDLLGLVAQGASADEASRLVQKAYGREALAALDRALESTHKGSSAFKRLTGLRARITGQ